MPVNSRGDKGSITFYREPTNLRTNGDTDSAAEIIDCLERVFELLSLGVPEWTCGYHKFTKLIAALRTTVEKEEATTEE